MPYNNEKRFCKGPKRMIAGVCDGIARYFDIDVVAVRLVFLLLLLFIGGGFLLYLILWIVMENPDSQSNEPTYRN